MRTRKDNSLERIRAVEKEMDRKRLVDRLSHSLIVWLRIPPMEHALVPVVGTGIERTNREAVRHWVSLQLKGLENHCHEPLSEDLKRRLTAVLLEAFPA